MILYLLVVVGIISILHGFFSSQIFFVGIGFAWCFMILAIASMFPGALKENDDYIRYKRQKQTREMEEGRTSR